MEIRKSTVSVRSGDVSMSTFTGPDCDIRKLQWERAACTVRMVKCPRCRCDEPIALVEWTKAPSCYPLWFWKECMEPPEPDTSSA